MRLSFIIYISGFLCVVIGGSAGVFIDSQLSFIILLIIPMLIIGIIREDREQNKFKDEQADFNDNAIADYMKDERLRRENG